MKYKIDNVCFLNSNPFHDLIYKTTLTLDKQDPIFAIIILQTTSGAQKVMHVA
jgi:hypothetical protein